MGDLYRFRVNLPGCILCLVDWTSRVTFFCQLFRTGRHPFERAVQSDGDGSSICVGSVFAYKLLGKAWLDLWEVCDFSSYNPDSKLKKSYSLENGRMSSLKREHYQHFKKGIVIFQPSICRDYAFFFRGGNSAFQVVCVDPSVSHICCEGLNLHFPRLMLNCA